MQTKSLNSCLGVRLASDGFAIRVPVCGAVVRRFSRLGVALVLALADFTLRANPEGLTVKSGTAATTRNGSALQVTVSRNAVLDWRSFNVKAGESTTFVQPSAQAVVWNRIFDQNPSKIWGTLNANGYVVLMNQSGFYFGPNSVINVGGFLATTTPVTPPGMAVGPWDFTGAPPTASIINYGQIKTTRGGSIFLLAEKIENHGVLTAPDGTLGLYAGKEVQISDSPDGRGLSVTVKLPEGSIDNTGKLIADAGRIALHAQVVNQNGLIQANSARERNGMIELFATESIQLGQQSVIQAKGGGEGISPGGTVMIKSQGSFTDGSDSRIEVGGGTLGGQGGVVELSAPHMIAIRSRLDATATAGWTSGRLTIDPTDIVIDASGKYVGGPDALVINPNTSFLGFSDITLLADRNIIMTAETHWNLNVSTGISLPGSVLRMEAGQDIFFNDNSGITAGAGWSIKMAAGADITHGPMNVPVGATVGSIYLNGGSVDAYGNLPNLGGALEATDGAITLLAAKDILVGSGYIRTVGGGNISLTTRAGDVHAGSRTAWYAFAAAPSAPGYQVEVDSMGAPVVGGIATTAGGNITIHAGNNISSIDPTTGALGGGDVSLTAGGTILGRFLVSDGKGTLDARGDIGSAGTPVSLGLIKGTWSASADNDLYLNEVFNPNGSLNFEKVGGVRFKFDYADDASVSLKAGHSVQLLGTHPSRNVNNKTMSSIYAPRLEIQAGSGGVVLGNDVTLYPSAQGGLSIKTTGGGSLYAANGKSYQIVMSDSDSSDYKTFVNTHTASPLNWVSDDPARQVRLDISGNLMDVRLQVPKKSDIHVAGDTRNFFFIGQNLLGTDVTRFRVDGDVRIRSDYTSIPIASVPNFNIFDSTSSTHPELRLDTRLSYNSVTKQLIFQGRMSIEQLTFLLSPSKFMLDRYGNRVLDSNGNPIAEPATFADPSILQALFTASQDVPSFPTTGGGLIFGGPGRVDFSARNLDLGVTLGLRSVLTGLNPALALPPAFNSKADVASVAAAKGADLVITLGYQNGDRGAAAVSGAGNLEISSSQIASFNGGAIDLMAAGNLNVGSSSSLSGDSVPKGIYTGHGGSVTVLAEGDININGSRIATYDGGDVSIISRQGKVDAGNGGKGFFSINTLQYNPVTRLVEPVTDRFFGSGVVTLTTKNSDALVGNIYVKAAKDIIANAGGMIQLAFNKVDSSSSTLELDAGGSIYANQSGILGANVKLKAGGSIQGLVVANQNVAIEASQNVSVTALGGGKVSVSAGEAVSGTIVSGKGSDVSGVSVSATVVAATGGATTSGDSSGASVGGGFTGVASAAPAHQTTTEADKPAMVVKRDVEEDPEKKKKKTIQLTRTVGRVTVILPNK